MNSSSWFKILRSYYQFKRLWRKALRLEKKVFVQDRTQFYREMWRSAAEEIGASFTPLTQTIWEVSCRSKLTRLDLYCTELDNPVTLNVAGDKALCHRLLSDGGLPVPDHLLILPGEISKAHEFVRNHQGYFVVKPAAGTSAARGITTLVRSQGECTRAIANASLYSQQVLIERAVPGELYRLLVLQDEVIHAIRRPGIRIKGDGKSSIAQLAVHELRSTSPSSDRISRAALDDDDDLLANLHAQKLNLNSILQSSSEWIIKSHQASKNLETGQLSTFTEDVTDQLGEEIKELAIEAARLTRSEFAGVELITPNTESPVQMGDGRIIEINTTPGLHHHYELSNDSGATDPAATVLRCLLGMSRLDNEQSGSLEASMTAARSEHGND